MPSRNDSGAWEECTCRGIFVINAVTVKEIMYIKEVFLIPIGCFI